MSEADLTAMLEKRARGEDSLVEREAKMARDRGLSQQLASVRGARGATAGQRLRALRRGSETMEREIQPQVAAAKAKEQQAAAKQTQQPQTQQPQNPTYPEPSTKAKSWAEKNEWFGSDRIMTSAAFQAHQDLIDQGFDAESDEYYNEIDKVMKENFPHKFSQPQEQKKPVQTVASAQRNQNGRRLVKLTKSQIVIAKKLGVPLEEYAKYVKENANG